MAKSPIIPAEEAKAEKWAPPPVNDDGAGFFRHEERKPDESEEEIENPGIPTAEEIEGWRAEAQREGFEQGYREGLAKGEAEARQQLDEQARQLRSLIDFFESPLQQLNEEVEKQLSLLAVTLAQQLVRREIRAEPGEIIGLIREAIKLLPANSRHIRITLHPEDAALLRNTLSLDSQGDGPAWQLIEDPMITRGGCEIQSDQSVINLTLENRLQALAASVLGGEREEDRIEPSAD
jgi:flagellar assembly protein FliH